MYYKYVIAWSIWIHFQYFLDNENKWIELKLQTWTIFEGSCKLPIRQWICLILPTKNTKLLLYLKKVLSMFADVYFDQNSNTTAVHEQFCGNMFTVMLYKWGLSRNNFVTVSNAYLSENKKPCWTFFAIKVIRPRTMRNGIHWWMNELILYSFLT